MGPILGKNGPYTIEHPVPHKLGVLAPVALAATLAAQLEKVSSVMAPVALAATLVAHPEGCFFCEFT